MTIRERNGKWQIREMRCGLTKSITLDHKPTKREAQMLIDNLFEYLCIPKIDTFYSCGEEYIKAKQNVLSPATVREYNGTLNRLSDEFTSKEITTITQLDVQREINRIAAEHAPKTVRNYHAFITSVLAMYVPNLAIKTTLPQKIKPTVFIPTDEQIKAILRWIKKNKYYCYVAFRLACYGLRRSEIMAITSEDVSGQTLSVNKAMVQNQEREWVIKGTKTEDSKREILIDRELAKLIKQQGKAYSNTPYMLWENLRKAQDVLDIPHFSFHKFRHYFVSKCIDSGIDLITIKAWVGHSDINMINMVYAHKMRDKEKGKKLIEIMESDIL